MRRSYILAVLPALALSGGVQAQISGEQPQSLKPGTSLKLTQKAWNERIRQRGASKARPGYVRYIYDPANVFPIQLREGMITTIKLPASDRLTHAFAGDDVGFQVGMPTPSTIAIKAIYPGVDTNLVAFTEDGRVFTFYLRSYTYDSDTISDFLVDVVNGGPDVTEGGADSGDGLAPFERMVREDAKNPAAAAARIRDPYASLSPEKRERYRDYADTSDFDPTTIVEDLGVYVPKGKVGGTVPYRIFRDDRFTYVDYGPNATQMTEWPVPAIVIQGVEGPVGFRTGGPAGRMLIMEALGDFVLRNGQRELVIRKRATVSANDKTLVEYPVLNPLAMNKPADIPPGRLLQSSPKPKTVVSRTDQPATPAGEAPSEVHALPLPVKGEEKIAAKGRPPAGPDIKTLTPAKPASPVQFVEPTGDKLGAGTQARLPIAAPLTQLADIPASSAVSAPLKPSEGAPIAAITPKQTGSAPTVQGAAPLTVGAPLGGYQLLIATGTAQELEARWTGYRSAHATLLNGKRHQVAQVEGANMLKIEPVSSVTEGVKLCSKLAADGAPCQVKPIK